MTPCVHPACMTLKEYEAWAEANNAVADNVHAPDPCSDCTEEFAIAMIAERRCDGPMASGDLRILRSVAYQPIALASRIGGRP